MKKYEPGDVVPVDDPVQFTNEEVKVISRFEVKGKENESEVVIGSLDVNKEGELELSVKHYGRWYAMAKLNHRGVMTVFGGVPSRVLNRIDLRDCQHAVDITLDTASTHPQKTGCYT